MEAPNSLTVRGGTVAIFLETDPRKTLLLPKKLLRTHAGQFFYAPLSGRWYSQRIYTLDGKTQLYQFGLALDYDPQHPEDAAWSLATIDTREAPEEDSPTRMWYSEPISTAVMLRPAYASLIPQRTKEPENPDKDARTALVEAVKAHRAMFTLLLGRKFDLDNDRDNSDQNNELAESDEDSQLTDKIIFLANIITYADFYGCTPSIAGRVGDLLWKLRDGNDLLMKDIAQNSAFYLGLAYHLQHEGLFEESMKHFASRPEHFQSLYRGLGVVRQAPKKLPDKVYALAYAKHVEILTLTQDLDRHLKRILRTSVTGELYLEAKKEDQKKCRPNYLAVGCIKDFLDHGSMYLNGDPKSEYYIPVGSSDYWMVSAPGVRTGRYFRDLMYTIQKDNGDLAFLGRPKPHNKLSQLFLLFTKSNKIERALKSCLNQMEAEISKVVNGELGGKPAQWQFNDDSFFFTNLVIIFSEYPWTPYKVPEGMLVAMNIPACAPWLAQSRLPEMADDVRDMGIEGKCECNHCQSLRPPPIRPERGVFEDLESIKEDTTEEESSSSGKHSGD